MNKQIIVRATIVGSQLILAVIFISIFASCNDSYDYELYRNPNGLASYDPEAGYHDAETGDYQIDPKTILTALENGETDVFTPLLENSEWPDEITDTTFSWTQEDFLEVASALGKQVWDDPMDLEDWSVYFIIFQGDCRAPTGFNMASITYFKEIEKNCEKCYVTRLIEIDTYESVVSWGSGATYPQTTDRWNGVDLAGAKITADDALRIAEENGGEDERLQDSNNCLIYTDASRENNDKWELTYITVTTPGIDMYIDFYTGKHELIDSP